MEDIIINGTSAIVGAACVASICLNRGDTYFDEKRKIMVSVGNGLSTKIIKKFPNYKHVSSSIDHFLEGFGGTLLIGGALGLGYTLLKDYISLDLEPIVPYYLGAASLTFKKIQWDTLSTFKRMQTYTLNDKLQMVADVGSIITPLAVINQYF
ncbi:MAG: hypothetical protein WC758_00125 [Candidatus Woesearchaeota archaeon]|jgi:hypothetical protein